MRHRPYLLGLSLASIAGCGAILLAACVGDDPTVGTAVDNDAATDSSSSNPDGGGTDALNDAPTDSPSSGAKVVHITAAAFTSCALYDDGKVKCWGSNTYGESGTGTLSPMVPKPSVVQGLTDAIGIGGGGNHVCAVTKTGSVKCWGANFYGTMGNGTTLGDGGAHAPQAVSVNAIANAKKVPSVNSATACALLDTTPPTGQCWGYDEQFQVGAVANAACTGASGPGACVPWPAIVQGGINIESIGGGSAHTCVSYGNSAVRCWGLNLDARLGESTTDGDGTTVTTTPIVVAGYAADELVAGRIHTCGRRGAGVSCWGKRSFGATGVGDSTDGTTRGPTVVQLPAPGAAKQLSAHGYNTCALLTNGAVACWGSNSHKQLGSSTGVTAGCVANPGGTADCRATAELVTSLTDATEIAVGNEHACALRTNGEVVCWGSNFSGQIGDGNTGVDVNAPIAVHF